MNKTIFLDRDGVINIDNGYVYKKTDFVFIPNIIEALRQICSLGYQLIIITNQSGIARGLYTVKDYKILTKYYLSILKKNGIKIRKVLFCPHHPEGIIKKYSIECSCRKPKVLLFEKAIKKYHVDINNSYAIGDNIRDVTISEKYSGIKPIIISKKIDNYLCFDQLIDFVFYLQSKEGKIC